MKPHNLIIKTNGHNIITTKATRYLAKLQQNSCTNRKDILSSNTPGSWTRWYRFILAKCRRPEYRFTVLAQTFLVSTFATHPSHHTKRLQSRTTLKLPLHELCMLCFVHPIYRFHLINSKIKKNPESRSRSTFHHQQTNSRLYPQRFEELSESTQQSPFSTSPARQPQRYPSCASYSSFAHPPFANHCITHKNV